MDAATAAGAKGDTHACGAANILRKTVPDAWEGTEDSRFLSDPETAGFKDLQRGSAPHGGGVEVHAIPADEVTRKNSTWYNRGVRAEQGEDETCIRRRE